MSLKKIPLTTQRYKPTSAFPKGYTEKWGFIPVTLEHERNVVNRVDTLIDTGASTAVYTKSVADDLGIDLISGEPSGTEGIGGSVITWYHTVRMTFGNWSYECLVGFMANDDLPVAGVLGYLGFFDRFKYIIDSSTDSFTIERLPKISK